jgi:hypothetical protein
MSQWEAVILAASVGLVYLALLRLVDVNEREPIWALGLLLGCGFVVGSQLRLVVGTRLLDLTVWPAIAAREAGVLLALLIGFAAFHGIERWRGWSEVSDVMDGLVYGAAAGLGTSVGELFVRELDERGIVASLTAPPTAWFPAAAALSGLALGLAGGITGAAVVGARNATSAGQRAQWLAGGFGLAFAVHTTIDWLAHGDALSGDVSVWRAWLALVLPCAALAGAATYALRVERRLIAAATRAEIATGTASVAEVELVIQPVRRGLTYLSALARGRVRQCRLQMSLHNRLVQLAIVRSRADRQPSPRSTRELEALRAAIHRLRQELSAASRVP